MNLGKLVNPRHETFCVAYEELIALGRDTPLEAGKRAYVMAGNTPNRANHNKLLRRPEVRERLAELMQGRESRARAARIPPEHILTVLDGHGIARVADFFELDGNQLLQPRDLKTIPVEVAIALLRFFREAMSIPGGSV